MNALKNIFVGFIVSFLGSIPLGYLNVIGFQIYQKSGINNVIPYLLGVILVEGIVIYLTLIFAKRLSNNKKLIKFIEVFSIFFMLLLAYSFFSQSNSESSGQDNLSKYLAYSSFVIGIILSCFNFIQIPFWTAWNLYLISAKYIFVEKSLKYLYLFGTLIGTFCGMLALILGLNLITKNSDSLSKLILSRIIPVFFLGMAIFQTFKFYKKYFKS